MVRTQADATSTRTERRGRKRGEADPQVVEDFNQIVALDQTGRLDEAVPGLAERFGGGAQGAGAR